MRVGPGGVPEPVARDLRHVRDDAWGTVWASPRWRAILLAAQGGGELVFYARQADYANAVRDARVGRLPEIPPPQMPERDWAR